MSKLSIAAGMAVVLATGFMFSAPVRAESVMKECGAEWKAAKAANTTKGQTWREFLADCRTRHAAAAPASMPAATPAAAPAAAPAPAPAPTAAAAPKPKAASRSKEGEFATEAEAKGHCPTDTVVWVNLRSHKYHMSGDRYYGKTKHGAYMCEGEAKAAGDEASKTMKPKS
jgi:hypothetical protein